MGREASSLPQGPRSQRQAEDGSTRRSMSPFLRASLERHETHSRWWVRDKEMPASAPEACKFAHSRVVERV